MIEVSGFDYGDALRVTFTDGESLEGVFVGTSDADDTDDGMEHLNIFAIDGFGYSLSESEIDTIEVCSAERQGFISAEVHRLFNGR